MKAVLFDLDETLLDRRVSLKTFVSHQCSRFFPNTDAERFVQRFIELDANGAVWKDIVYSSLVEEFSLNDVSVDTLLEDYVTNFRSFCQAKPGALEAIKTLHSSGFKLGLVSNGKSPFQEQCFEALGMAQLFDAIIVSDAVGHRKPDPNIFLLACRQLLVEPHDAVFVGDNPVADIEGANAIGMYTLYIPGHFGSQCAQANAVCEQFADLPGLVRAVC